MFKNIQNHLLLQHPLLWNTKFVPVLAITVFINIIFFIWGYIAGAVNFSNTDEYDIYSAISDLVAFFNVVISILVFILWLVYYFRNNAFKSFYPKKDNSLFKEWIFILVICIFNCLYSLTFAYAYELRARNYFDEETVLKRADIISRASIFTEGYFYPEGSFDNTQYNENVHPELQYNNPEYGYDYTETVPVETAPVVEDTVYYEDPEKDSICHFANLYHVKSLMNKQTISFTLQNRERDSINEWKVKQWMYEKKKDSILTVLQDFLELAETRHGLKANITAVQWLDLVYNPADYTDYYTIGKDFESVIHHAYDYKAIHDTKNNIIKIEDGEKVPYPKYHVPFNQLRFAYARMSNAYSSPLSFEALITLIHFAFALSLLIFSFRATSGKNWLISAVSLGITGLVTFIFVIALGFLLIEYIDHIIVYFYLWLGIITFILFCFLYLLYRKTTKSISGIFINILLWLLPTVMMMVYAIVLNYYEINEYNVGRPRIYDNTRAPLEIWLEENIMLYFYVNLLLVVCYMYPFTRAIKKWKGIAEA